jgi:PAS domain S-box-containing protein
MKIRTKVNLSFLGAFILVSSLVGLIVGIYTANLVRDNTYSYLRSSNRAQAEHVRTFIQDQQKTAVILAAASVYLDFLREPMNSKQYPIIKDKITKRLARTIEADPQIYETLIIGADGKVRASSEPSAEGDDESQDDYFIEGQKGVFIKDAYFLQRNNKLTYAISAPVKDDDGSLLEGSVLRYDPRNLYSIVKSENDLGPTEENFLVNKDHFFITPSLFLGEGVIMKQKAETKNVGDCFDPEAIKYVEENGYNGLATAGLSEIVEAKDYRGVDIVGTHAYIPETGWCLITKADKADIMSFRITLISIFLGIFTFGWLVYLLIAFWFSKRITNPIKALADGAEKMQEGKFDYQIEVKSNDEIGLLTKTFNQTGRKLAGYYKDLESKVYERTLELKSQNIKLGESQKAITNVLEDSQELAKDLAKFKLAVDGASEHVIITDREGVTLYMNKAAEKITGYSVAEALGKKAGTLWGLQMPKSYYEEMWRTIKTEKKTFIGELHNRRRNGEIYDAEISIAPVLNEQKEIIFFVGIERDVTEQKRSQEAVNRLAAIVRDSDDAITGKDLEGNIISWNKGAEKLYGYTAEEVVGKNVSFLLPPEKQTETKEVLLKVKEGRPVEHFQTIRKRKDGSLVDVSITASPVRGRDGKVVAVSIVARDTTKEKQIDKAKTEFVSLASHQLRTPLSTIRWYSEMVMSGDVGAINDEQKKYLSEIYKANQRMIDLVNALLNTSRIELGTFMINPEPVDLKKIAGNALEELQEKIAHKHLQVNDGSNPNIPIIPLDSKLTHIIFQNLLSNAVKYTRDNGSITWSILLDNDSGFARLPTDKKYVLIKVADNGLGIPFDAQDKIFTKLYRADNVREADPEGTGLGLYLAKSIVEHASGQIWFESKPDQGATFYVALPLEGMKRQEGDKELS